MKTLLSVPFHFCIRLFFSPTFFLAVNDENIELCFLKFFKSLLSMGGKSLLYSKTYWFIFISMCGDSRQPTHQCAINTCSWQARGKEAKEEEKGWVCRDNITLKLDRGVKEHSNITFTNISVSISEPAVNPRQACGSRLQSKTPNTFKGCCTPESPTSALIITLNCRVLFVMLWRISFRGRVVTAAAVQKGTVELLTGW